MDKDFEIKRLVIGLSTIIFSQNAPNLDDNIKARFQDIFRAIVQLCQKSVNLRMKQQQREQR
jgi:hypothetical protein